MMMPPGSAVRAQLDMSDTVNIRYYEWLSRHQPAGLFLSGDIWNESKPGNVRWYRVRWEMWIGMGVPKEVLQFDASGTPLASATQGLPLFGPENVPPSPVGPGSGNAPAPEAEAKAPALGWWPIFVVLAVIAFVGEKLKWF